MSFLKSIKFDGPIQQKTNGEMLEIEDKLKFLLWMHRESAPVPASKEEMETLLRRWIVQRRSEGIWA